MAEGIEVTYGVSRTIRIRHYGFAVYHVEQMQPIRGMETPNILCERWVVIARCDGPDARLEAFGVVHEIETRLANGEYR